MDDLSDLVGEFLIECHQRLDRMEHCVARLIQLEARPRDAALVDEIFRSVHTIKGTAGFFRFPRLEALAHAGEDLLSLVRRGAVPVGSLVIPDLRLLLDGMRSILYAIEANGNEGEGNDEALISRLGESHRATWDHPHTTPIMHESPELSALGKDFSATCETAMDARRQPEPVSRVFARMPHLVRSLAERLDRRVRLQIEGTEITLSKDQLEAVRDSLTHAVRNALDHGIEPPEIRSAAGKSPEGTLTLRARQEGGQVLVEIVDDGGGIAVEKVRDRAIELGLIPAASAPELPEREVLRWICVPGLSTVPTVTRVSGRGVGMDAMRASVEGLGGRLQIESTEGNGTTIRLWIPVVDVGVPEMAPGGDPDSFVARKR